MQEPTNANLTEEQSNTLPQGGDIKEAISNLELNPSIQEENLGNIAEIINVSAMTETLPYLTA